MASGGPLLDEVAFLPMHLKLLLLDSAPRVAPLNDASLDALLLEPEDIAKADAEQGQDGLQDGLQGWEAKDNDAELIPERQIDRLDLSHSRISLAMFRQVMLTETDGPGTGQPILRLPKLRSLNLSSSTLTLTASLLAILSHCPLQKLSIAGLSCNLYLPLQSIALALPTLEYLDISDSDWMNWSHLAKLDWCNLFPQLTTLRITRCEGLAPNASFQDPEGKSGGPAIIMQAMSTVREAGRVKWLDVIA
jgi:hypothetical protein